MATSAIWKATVRPWLTTFAPILISFSFKLVSDQSLIGSGVASVRRKIKNHQLSWWFDGEPLKAVSKDSATFGMGLWDH